MLTYLDLTKAAQRDIALDRLVSAIRLESPLHSASIDVPADIVRPPSLDPSDPRLLFEGVFTTSTEGSVAFTILNTSSAPLVVSSITVHPIAYSLVTNYDERAVMHDVTTWVRAKLAVDIVDAARTTMSWRETHCGTDVTIDTVRRGSVGHIARVEIEAGASPKTHCGPDTAMCIPALDGGPFLLILRDNLEKKASQKYLQF